MINVEEVIHDVPHFETFCSISKLHRMVELLATDSRFHVIQAGVSVKGVPIHHVRFGTGSVKALIVAFPDCMEPIGGLTVFSLLELLRCGHPQLTQADVEWNIIPCIDPDGALINEAWTQSEFTLEKFMRNYFVQSRQEQVDNSFPINYKKLSWKRPSHEARILQRIIDEVQPDFFFSLHNAWTGGAHYLISEDVGASYYQELYRLLEQQRFPLQRRPIWKEICTPFSEGVVEIFSVKRLYDHLERTTEYPERMLPYGTGSWDYLKEIKPDTVSLIVELGYVKHPSDESEVDTGRSLRNFKLRIDADSKYLGTVLLEEWDEVKDDLDPTHPIYRSVTSGRAFPPRDKLSDGPMPLGRYPTQDVLFNPQYSKPMTEADMFNACMTDGGFFFLLFSYQFVRLLKASQQTNRVRSAIDRLERAYDDAWCELDRSVNFDRCEVFPFDTLARVQLGSGLVVLNSVLDQRRKSCPRR